MDVPMPLGIIEESDGAGGVMTLLRPGDRRKLRHDTPVAINYHDELVGKKVRMRGLVTEVSSWSAGFRVTETDIDPGWPEGMDPKPRGIPVYLASPHGFEPDPERLAGPAELAMLNDLAGNPPSRPGFPATLS